MTALWLVWLDMAITPSGWMAMLYAGLLVSFAVFGRMAWNEDDEP